MDSPPLCIVDDEEDGSYQLVSQLRRENAALKAQLEAFERKFIELQKGRAGEEKIEDDIIMLNVGGKYFSILRSTLRRYVTACSMYVNFCLISGILKI
jgi:hypothetical protein